MIWCVRWLLYGTKIMFYADAVPSSFLLNFKELRSEKKFQNLEAKKSALLWLKSHNFSET